MLVSSKEDKETVRVTVCPSCGEETQFKFIGVQRWPRAIAVAKGIPMEQELWSCGNCGSTLSDQSLKD